MMSRGVFASGGNLLDGNAQNTVARDLNYLLVANQDTIMHEKLFKTKCPRVCVPLVDKSGKPDATWADEVLASANPQEGENPQHNFLLASILLAAARRRPQYTETANFRNAYRWWFGDDSASLCEKVQIDVIKALNKDPLGVLKNQERLPRAVAFVENDERMWMFFVDGRVDFTKLLKADGTSTPLFPALDDGAEADLCGSATRQAMDACNRAVAQNHVCDMLNESATVAEQPAPSAPRGISYMAACLRRFEPGERTAFENCIAEVTCARFTAVSCSSSVPFKDVLQWPAPKHRAAFVTRAATALQLQPSRTPAADEVLQLHAQHRARMQRALGANTGSDNEEDLQALLADNVEASSSEDAAEKAAADSARLAEHRKQQSAEAHQALLDALTSDKGSVFSAEIHDDDVNDFMEGRNDNPRMRIQVARSADSRHARSFHGNYVDIFREVDAASKELAALQGGGAAALDRAMSSTARDADALAAAQEELSRISSLSATGAAMRKKFEEMNVFREYRRLNDAELARIRNTYKKGTPDYEENMERFRDAKLKQASDAFFGRSPEGQRVSPVIRETRAWLASEKEQLPEMPLVSKELTPFGNFIFNLLQDLDEAFSPGSTMEDAVLCVLTATAGFWHHENLRPNILLAGEASVGKSYTLRISASLMPDGVSFACTHETDKAGLVDGMKTDLLQTFEELPQHMIGSDAYGNEREVSSHQKDRLTNIYRTTVTIEVTKDPESGELVRRPRIFHSCEEIARQAATNAALPPSSNPQLARFIVRMVNPSRDPEDLIFKKMHALDSNNPNEYVSAVRKHWKLFFAIQLYIEKMIECKAISDVNMDAMCEMKEMLEFVTRKYNFDCNDPKMYDKIHGVARLITVSYAIYLAVCSERGMHLRYRDGNMDQHAKLSDVCVQLAKEVEKHLVCTREVVVYVFSLMRSEWMPSLRQEILRTIRKIYLDGRIGFEQTKLQSGEKNVARAPLIFCSSINSDIAKQKQYVDSSYIWISDENGSTRPKDVARFIAKHITTRSVSAEMVDRELRAMRQMVVRSPIWVHSVGEDRNKTRPKWITGKHAVTGADEVLYHEKPLFVCGKVREPTRHGGGTMQSAHGAQSRLFRSSSDEAQQYPAAMGGFGTSNNDSSLDFQQQQQQQPENDETTSSPFACMILYDAIQNPSDHFSIIQAAVESLSHKNIAGHQDQTFVTSEPLQRTVVYPRSTDSVLGNHSERSHTFTFYNLPSMVTVYYRPDRMRTLPNERPLIDAARRRRREFRSGARGTISNRYQELPGADSDSWVMGTDPDYIALQRHHEEIGIKHDTNCHWLAMKFILRHLKESKFGGESEYTEVEQYASQYVHRWHMKNHVQSITSAKLTAAEAAEHEAVLASTIGYSHYTAFGARKLTTREVEMRTMAASQGVNVSETVREETEQNNLRVARNISTFDKRIAVLSAGGTEEDVQRLIAEENAAIAQQQQQQQQQNYDMSLHSAFAVPQVPSATAPVVLQDLRRSQQLLAQDLGTRTSALKRKTNSLATRLNDSRSGTSCESSQNDENANANGAASAVAIAAAAAAAAAAATGPAANAPPSPKRRRVSDMLNAMKGNSGTRPSNVVRPPNHTWDDDEE